MASSLTSNAETWFRVEVSDKDGQVVAIEPELLSGRDITGTEQVAIQRALRHLRAFAGFCEHDQPPQDCLYCGELAPSAGDFI